MSSVPPRDRPDDEIEVTPEMIEAGVRRLMTWDGVLELEETRARAVVKDVLEAALKVAS